MKVLVLGSGGREHALAHALSRSRHCSEVLVAPGNDGMRDVARLVPVPLHDLDGLVQAAQHEEVGLTIAGSEEPLVRGIWDLFDAHGLRLVGPSSSAAALEGSKAFAKEFMRRHDVPTARYAVFEDFESARRALDAWEFPLVVKADGLAAGKGVHIVHDRAQAEASLHAMLDERRYGDSGRRVVLEAMLTGPELSLFALCDGYSYRILGCARDHKRAYDGDEGPNTGGMGAYSPVPEIDDELLSTIGGRVFAPTLAGLVDEGAPYRGFLYAGLMLTSEGPQVLEFNCRLGDPEAQVVLPRVRSDLLELLLAVDSGDVHAAALDVEPAAAVGVVVASEGYPESPRAGVEVRGIEAARAAGAEIYCAGVRLEDGRLVTSGGRVVTVVGRGVDVAEARRIAYAAAEVIEIPGSFYRRDIALGHPAPSHPAPR
jgi:phosphoribosylamine---glycine ligase